MVLSCTEVQGLPEVFPMDASVPARPAIVFLREENPHLTLLRKQSVFLKTTEDSTQEGDLRSGSTVKQ
jgi:hypothetical protein